MKVFVLLLQIYTHSATDHHSLNTIKVKVNRSCIAVNETPVSISQQRSVACHMGSHSVTFHPIQVNTPRLNPSQTGRYLISLPRKDGRLSWPTWLVTYRGGLHVSRQSPIPVVTGPDVEQLRWLRPTTPRRHPIPYSSQHVNKFLGL